MRGREKVRGDERLDAHVVLRNQPPLQHVARLLDREVVLKAVDLQD